MSERVLTTVERRLALLARQLLLERVDLAIPAALERVGGLQDQYAPSGYIGLWSRLRDFRREALTEALEARTVVQGTLMRATIHLVSAADYPLFAAGTVASRREWWRRVQQGQVRGLEMEGIAARVRELLADGPRRQAAMIEALEAETIPRLGWLAAGQWVDLLRIPPSGTWAQRRADLYGLAESWLGAPAASEVAGLEHLLRRYLQSFGPATLADAARWAGVPATRLRPAMERLDLQRFRDEEGRLLLDLPDGPLPDATTLAPVRFLPTWEAMLLVHARGTLVLPEVHRARIFNTRTPHSVPTFLVDGQVAGTWRHDGGRILVEPFAPLPAARRREVEKEAERLAAFHAA